MGLLYYDFLSLEVKEEKIGQALKFEFIWGFGAGRCASVSTPWEQLLPWQQWMETQNNAKRWRIKTENLQSVLAWSLIIEHEKTIKAPHKVGLTV